MQPISHLLEAALYVDDLNRAEAFYSDVLGLPVLRREAGRHVFFQVGDSVLLVFHAAETLKGTTLPAHGASGPGHVALGIRRGELQGWRDRLEKHGLAIEKLVDWPHGGSSLYFRDPDGNTLMLHHRYAPREG